MFRDTPKAALASQDEEFLGGFELEESLLVPGWEAFLPEAEVRWSLADALCCVELMLMLLSLHLCFSKTKKTSS